MCRAEYGESREELKIYPCSYRRILCQKSAWKQQALLGYQLGVKRELILTHQALEAELEMFVSFTRNLRLPVMRQLMQERTKIAPTALAIEEFKASNGVRPVKRYSNTLRYSKLNI